MARLATCINKINVPHMSADNENFDSIISIMVKVLVSLSSLLLQLASWCPLPNTSIIEPTNAKSGINKTLEYLRYVDCSAVAVATCVSRCSNPIASTSTVVAGAINGCIAAACVEVVICRPAWYKILELVNPKKAKVLSVTNNLNCDGGTENTDLLGPEEVLSVRL